MWCSKVLPMGSKRQSRELVSETLVFAMGFCILMGKHIVFWNEGLGEGLWAFFTSTVIVGIGFICLTLSFAEMVSMLPFTGGSYGYVRCSLGPWWGYLVGCCEATKYILFQGLMVQQVAKIVYLSLNISSDWAPLIWFATMGMILATQLSGKRVFWITTVVLAALSIILLLMFILEAGAESHAFHDDGFHDGGSTFFRYLPATVAFFGGIDAMRTCADTQSNRTMPRNMVVCIAVTFVIALCLITTASSLTADSAVLESLPFPLSEGFSVVLELPLSQCDWFSMPGALACSFAFTYAFGRQLRSMAGSGLLPSFLSTTHAEQQVASQPAASAAAPEGHAEKDAPMRRGSIMGSLKGSLKKVDSAIKHHVPKKPAAAMLTGSLLSFISLLPGHFAVHHYEIRYMHMYAFLCAVVYSFLSLAYMVFLLRYSNIERNFRSPLGIGGAVVSIFVFLIVLVCVSFLQPGEHSFTLVVFAGLYVFFYGYYVLVAKKRQFFSKEEQEKFMKAYVVNANTQRRKGNTGSKGGLSDSSQLLNRISTALGLKSSASIGNKKSSSHVVSFSQNSRAGSKSPSSRGQPAQGKSSNPSMGVASTDTSPVGPVLLAPTADSNFASNSGEDNGIVLSSHQGNSAQQNGMSEDSHKLTATPNDDTLDGRSEFRGAEYVSTR